MYELKREDTSAARCRGVSVLALLFLLATLLTGCVTDSGADCEYPLRLRFSYIYNREDKDLLRDEVGRLRLYLYDTDTRGLVATRDLTVGDLEPDNSLIWKVPPGRHILVAWGGGDRYVVENASEGFFAHSVSLPSEPSDEGNIVRQSREHLWHSCLTDIRVNGDISPVYDVELRKISNDINVRVHLRGIDPSTESECRISATNGRYAANGDVSAVAPTVYLPEVSADTPPQDYDSTTLHQFTTLGLWASDDSHLTLTLDEYPKPVYDGSLTQHIDTLHHLDFGLDDTFDLDFYVSADADGNLSVELEVNHWKVVNYKVILK